MAVIDARERFERRRYENRQLRKALEAGGGAVLPRPRVPVASSRTPGQLGTSREIASLVESIEELNSYAEELRAHSELLTRETRTLLRRLRDVLQTESRMG
jgi:hypothetical protein